jgi:hypothetical protein
VLGVRTAACSWREGREVAVPLIVEHNQRMGNVDRPDLVDFRIGQWKSQDGVRVLVYKAWPHPARTNIELRGLSWGYAAW